jgi:hypothetical protein
LNSFHFTPLFKKEDEKKLEIGLDFYVNIPKVMIG